MFNFTGGTLTLTNSTVSGNSASRGGGVYNIGTANFANSIISENSASLIGGGILTFGRLTLKNSIISGNFSNSTGGLLIGSENTILINCTLSGNSSEGVFINGGTATFTNTIVATNDQDIFLSAATIIDGGNNLIGNGTGQNVLVNGTNGNQVGTTGSEIDPLFIKDVPSTATMPSSGGDLRLACGSPAIDAGSNASAMGTSDLNGYPRIADGSGNGTMTVDIGAHERVTFTTNHIVTTTADKGPGSLRDLATAACPGDTITFDMAIDGMPIMLTSGEITLNKNLVILGNPAAGSGQAPKTIIDGQANSRIFSITSGDTVTIDGVTLQNGEALGMFFPDDRGGAIVNDGVLNIFNSHLSHNTARFGGAIINQGTGVLEVSNSTITENTAVIQGGGVLSFGTVGIKKTFVTNNSAESGGGVHNDEGTLDISNSIISGNTAMTNGGGVVNTGISTLTNSVISGNTAANGGGLHNGGGAGSGPEIISIINTTIAGNAASSRGGGIYNLTGISRFTNSIVAANTDDGSGPDIFKDSGTITNNGNNLIGINKDVLTEFPEGPLVGTTTSPLDPLFVDMADMAMLPNTSGDLRLQCGSPAIDVGKADTTGLNLGTVDIAGMSRIVTKTVDIGAYEFQLSQAPTPLTLVTNTNDAGCGSLRFAICNAMPGDTIRFNPSIDGNTIKLTSGEIVIDTTIHIFGNDSSKTIIDGQGLNRLFSIQPGDTLYIDKVTLQNGDATIPESNGGAIFNEGFLSVKNSLLKNNYTNGNGGAIYNTNGSSIQLTASFFLENTASFGGGIYFSGNSSATADATSFSKNNGLTNGGAIFMKDSSSAMLSNLTFSSNEAFDGGAVYNNSSDTMSCSQVTFSQNSARSFGGAIYSESGNILFEKSHLILNSAVVQGGAIDTRANTTIQFSNSIVSGNTARLSAGISNGGKATITNSIISGNKAEINSGGIANSGTASLKNVTITGNEAVLAGGIANVGTTTLVNTIVAKNIATDAHPDIYKANGTVNNNGSNLIGINSSIEMEFPADGYLVGTLLSPVDPWFISDALPAPESSVEFQLACGSPAVDAGTPDTTGLGLAGTDIIGLPRIVGKRIDIGAYELQESSYPDDITHVTNTNDAGCGSLRFAICNAMPGDTVTFDSSIDGNTIRLFTGEIVIDTNLVILGNDSTKTIIDGQANSRIFHIPEGDSVYIKGLTLQNGNAVGVGITLLGGPYGGAIQNGGVLHLSDCNIANNSITGNTASWGGGIYNAGEVFIDNCTFQNNRAKTGGAIFSSGNSTITGCIISKNRVFRENSHGGSGAGIYNSALLSNTIMNISNSAITGNIIENDSGSGGGVSNAGTLAILNSTISGNTGNNGGGVYNDGTASFTNSSISGNTSSVFGGGMYNTASATASFNNTTISGNSASSLGGGLYNTGSATANFNNSIIALNAASSRGQDIDKNSGTINSKNSLIGTDSGDHGIMNGANGNQVGTDASPLAPLFVMMVDTSSLPNTTGDLSLACGSPAIDAGTPDTTGLNIGLSDINGMPRIAGTAIDMGAYEKENVCQNINVFGNGILIAKQDNTPDISDGTSLGETCNTLVDTFYIKNDKQLLIIDNIAITPVNSNPGSFTSNQATFPDTIIGGDSLLIQITFNPTQTGADGALVTIESNDLDDDPFTFIIAAAKDTTPPTSLCQDIEVTLDRLGNASITPEQLNMNSSDNCNIQGYTVSKSTFTCADIGTNEVMLTVTDVNGNSSSCTSSVTVKDMTFSSPTISGPTSICPSSSGWNYAVPVNPDVAVYQWSYSGSGVTINGNGTSNVNLDFSTNATSGVLSVDLVSVCGNTGGSATLALEIASPEACNLARCLERNLFIDSELLQINSSPQYFKVDGKITTNAMVQQYLELIASGGIEIYPGFTVESSDEFVARIEACAAALHQKSENKN